MQTKIYVLLDERGLIRYVGKTHLPLCKRFYRHLFDGRIGVRTHKACWIRGMLGRGFVPKLDVIQIVDGDGANEERKWISFFRDSGIDLTNATDGGEGNPGHICSEETRRKMSESQKRRLCGKHQHNWGKPVSDETRRKISLANKGRRFTEGHKAAISEGKTGKAFSEQHRKNLSISHSGPKHTNYGKHLSVDTRRRIAAGVKKLWAEGKRTVLSQSPETGRWIKSA